MDSLQAYAEITSAALGFLAAVIIAVYGGGWLDQMLGTRGVMFIIVLVLGLTGALVNLLRLMNKIQKAKNNDAE